MISSLGGEGMVISGGVLGDRLDWGVWCEVWLRLGEESARNADER